MSPRARRRTGLPPSSPTRRELLLDATAGLAALTAASACAAPPTTAHPAAPAAPAPGAAIALPTGDVHDFDFLVGTWRGVNRRLTRRWVGSTDWDTFPGELRCESRMGSVINLSEVAFPTRGWSGVTLRTFDLQARRWSSYWINSRTGVLFPPQVGGFTGDHVELYGDDTDDGRPVKVRIRWTRLDPGTARWEQAFSLDGATWETNWTADQTRTG